MNTVSNDKQQISARRNAKALRETRERFREIGWQFYLRKEFALAEKNYLRAIEIESGYPNLRDPTLYLLLGHVFYQQELFEKALEQYEKACERAVPPARYRLPKWLRRTATKPAVDQNYYHSYVANANFKLRRYDEAIQQFRLALRAELRSELRAEILNGIGTSYKERMNDGQDFEEALRHCLEAEIYDSANPEWPNDSGIVYYYQALEIAKKDQPSAITVMHKALERFKRAHDLARRTAGNGKDYSEKIPDYRYDQANAYYLLSQWTEDRGEKQQHQTNALGELRFSLTKLPLDDQANIHDLRGSILVDLGETKKALTEAQKAVELFPKKHSYHASLGYVHYQAKEYDDAIAAYSEALTLWSADKGEQLAKTDETANNYRDWLGRAYYAARRDDEAIKQYQGLVESNPTSYVFANALGNAYFSKGEFEPAIIAYQNALNLSPEDQILKENLARAYYNLAEQHRADLMYPEAAHEYEIAIGLHDEPNYHLGLAHCYSSMEEAERAVEEYHKAALNDSDPDFHYWLGLAHKRAQAWDKAEAEYLETLKLNADHADAQRSLGLLYQAAGRYEEAVTVLERLLKKKPKDIDILMALGLSELEVNNTKRALVHLERANKLAPDDARTYSSLGQALNRNEQYAEARALLEKGIKSFPDDEYIKEELAAATANSDLKKDEETSVH